MDWQDHIVTDPKIAGGKPVVAGTRVPVQVILGSLAGGDSIEAVCEGYGVSRDDVLAALAYAAEALAHANVYLVPG
ncbi:MAG: DUF433 domain-containing protein [Dehalococcoidia bacterium]|nr:DUF433 domain-containing protein [Dehalococcoidia bacterium]